MPNDALRRRLAMEQNKANAARLQTALSDVRHGTHTLDEVDPAGQLHQAATALSRLRYTVGDFDLVVWAGPANVWGLQMTCVGDALTVRLVRSTAPASPAPAARAEPVSVVSGLAQLLGSQTLRPRQAYPEDAR